MQNKVAILGARYGDLGVEERMLRPLKVKIAEARGQSEEDIVAISRGAQVILCGGAPKVTTAVIRQLPDLKAVVRYGIGVDTVASEVGRTEYAPAIVRSRAFWL